MAGGIDFEIRTQRGGSGDSSGLNPGSDDPFRILLLGDFGAARGTRLGQALLTAVDLDTIDGLWDRHEPATTIALAGTDMVFAPRDLEDFHPDQLIRTLPAFRSLHDLRKRLLDSTTAEAALKEVLGSTTSNAATSESEAAEGDDASLFDQLIGAASVGTDGDGGARNRSEKPAKNSGSLDALLREVVSPHVVAGPDARVEAAIDAVDLGLAELLRQVLADQGFRALEARWRGLYELVQRCELDETVELQLLSIETDALLAALPNDADQLADCDLWRLLRERSGQHTDAGPPALIVLDMEIKPDPNSIALLATFGAMAESLDATVLAAAAPGLIGAAGVDELADPAQWAGEDAVNPLWQELRKAPFAERIALLLPRLLARLPYGNATDPVSTFDFEELDQGTAADTLSLPSCNPVHHIAALLIDRFLNDGWSMDPTGAAPIEDLPVFSYKVEGEARLQPATEVLMSEATLNAALARGASPLAGYRNQDQARLIRLQSIAAPLRPLRGRWRG